MKIKFDTTIKAERVRILRRLAKKAGLLKGWYQVNVYEETLSTDNGTYCMDMTNQGTYFADCVLWNIEADRELKQGRRV